MAGVLIVGYLVVAYVALPIFWMRYTRHHPSLADIPNITHTADGIPGDPLNVSLIGTEIDLKRIMRAAQWYPADPLSLRSRLEIASAAVFEHPYDDAPVSNLYLWGRKEDLAFEQPVGNDPRQRHHVRFWRTDKRDPDGRPVWVGAAIFDERVGLSHTTGQITHHTAPDIDAERDTLFADLQQPASSQKCTSSMASTTFARGGMAVEIPGSRMAGWRWGSSVRSERVWWSCTATSSPHSDTSVFRSIHGVSCARYETEVTILWDKRVTMRVPMSCRAEVGGRVVHPSLECSTVRGKERFMKSIVSGFFGFVVAGVLAGCVTQKKYDTLETQYQQLNQTMSAEVAAKQMQITRLQNAIKVTVNNGLLFPSGDWEMPAEAQQSSAKSSRSRPTANQHVNGYTDSSRSARDVSQQTSPATWSCHRSGPTT